MAAPERFQIAGTAPLGDGFMVRRQGVFRAAPVLCGARDVPRYRYDQVMRLGWKVFIPVTLVWIIFIGGMMQTRWAYLFH